ncbi:MAG: hypothetical protein RL701_6162 [Pseudomonadota bacterium]
MILLSNSHSVGLLDRKARFYGTYAAAFEGSALVGVVGHFWNCNCILQTREDYAAELSALAVRTSGRPLAGMLGPAGQVRAALAGLGIAPRQLRLDSIESLYQLSLSALRVPPELASGKVRVRPARQTDLTLLSAWRAAFCVEALHVLDTPELHQTARDAEQRGIADGHIWLAEVDGQVVATSGFNAAVAEAVQIGGVYTPVSQRRRGYARAAVAQSLLDARARGVSLSLLFTGDDNVAAQRAYRALGYERTGDYRIVTVEEPCFLLQSARL